MKGDIRALFLIAIFGLSCSQEPSLSEENQLALANTPTNIYFLGDSITAGYGYFPDNSQMTNNFIELSKCKPKPHSENPCSNSQPVPVGPASASASGWVAYSFQFRDLLKSARLASKSTAISNIYNLAVSGSTPANWDAVLYDDDLSQEKKYLADNQFVAPKQIPKDSLIVLTLGANPLLSRWLQVIFRVDDALGLKATATDGPNAAYSDTSERATSRMSEDIKNFKLREHLTNIYKVLLERGNVLVQKYYHVCPGSFGRTNPSNFFQGPGGMPRCTPSTSAIGFSIVDQVNDVIDEVVASSDVQAEARKYNHRIAAICPGNKTSPTGKCELFDNHQFKSAEPWIISVDTGIHPNIAGHYQLARGVLSGACEKFGYFCEEQKFQEFIWPTNVACPSSEFQGSFDAGRCVYISISNQTPYTLNLDSAPLDHGTWRVFPPAQILPGETARMFALRALALGAIGNYGTIGFAAYSAKTAPHFFGTARTNSIGVYFANNLDHNLYGEGTNTATQNPSPDTCGAFFTTEIRSKNDSGDSHVLNLRVGVTNQDRCVNYYDPIATGKVKCGDGYCFPDDVSIPDVLKSTTCDCACIKTNYRQCIASNALPRAACRGETGKP